MEEGVQCQSPSKIRKLYAIRISSWGLFYPQTLWNKYKEYMAEDIQQVHAAMTFNQHIYNETLIISENKVITMVGKKLHDFGMISSREVDGMISIVKLFEN
ncbi:uncharacterized protein TNIN_267271 [Trichonephila inaurata madagascariensis]|uniref:Uncharacterized protein n=1 Tax=Trichonephila inaurata madagascariensis TaxID=2747483 RepID=A0A8X6MDD8_9ARAC|nr:uncharacterized protein TNIN_267271 [Trichonephila inaurata madagascariensis]